MRRWGGGERGCASGFAVLMAMVPLMALTMAPGGGAAQDAAGAPAAEVPFRAVPGPPGGERARSRGAAWGDVDGDGDPDLVVSRAVYDGTRTSPPPSLYRNEGGGVFTRLDLPMEPRAGDGEGVVWVDVDNDGDLDLHVAGRGGFGSVFFENRGGALQRREVPLLDQEVASVSMACWTDVDGDGLLDVFLVGYREGRNALYRSTAPWRFQRAPLPAAGAGDGTGRACAAGDLDGDGLPELVVANARTPNLLLRNRGGVLVADSSTALQHDAAYGYGLSWTDANGDGLRDLFVANFDAPNTLYLGSPGGGLVPSPLGAALASAASKGHSWGDFDLDGFEDLYLGSGTPAPDMVNALYLSDGAGGFRPAQGGPATEDADTSAAIAWADVNEDGALDLFVANWGSLSSPDRLYVNGGSRGSWIKVILEGVRSNRMGLGARVSVLTRAGERARWQHRWLDAATGYAGQNEPIVHFGLGSAEQVDSLVVRWPSGVVDRVGPEPARQVLRLREGAPPG